MDCLFCKVIKRNIPSEIVFEDDDLMAFNDIAPQAPIHKLIVPKRHIATLNELNDSDDQLIGKIIRSAAKIARDCDVAEDGYRTVFNCNGEGGQTVFHIHCHLLAGRQMAWPPG